MNSTRAWFLPCLLSLLIVALVSAPAAVRASAQDAPPAMPSYLIEPVGHEGPYFDVEIKPGKTETLTVALGNDGTTEAPARTFAADVYSLVNGGFGINSEDDPTTGATTWLDYEAETLDIPAGRMLEREFTVTVPKGTKPGQYITGLVIQTAEPIAIGGSDMLKQNIVKVIAVFITVPGKLTPKLEIGAASLRQGQGSNSLVVEVTNAGNVLLKPEGTVEMTAADGETILTAPVTMGSVYAGTSTSIELAIPIVVAPGRYAVHVELKDAETRAKAKASDLPVTSVDPALAASPVVEPIQIGRVSAEPVLDPGTGGIQLVNVTVSLTNDGGPLTGARLTLHVERDGALVEDFPLGSSLVIASGTTEVQQRYVPLGRWEPGSYTFSATLEATDLATGQVTLLDTVDAAAPVVVP